MLAAWQWLAQLPEPLQPAQFRHPDDRSVSVINLGNADPIRLRLHAKKILGDVGFTVRFLPARPRTLEETGVPADLVQLAQTRSAGIILICGATNAGKSTTGYAVVDHVLTTQKIKVVTYESPPEVIISNEGKLGVIQQHDIPNDLPDYTTAHQSSLRDDPDVVLYSELRSDEAIQKAVEEANTGHLVFGTLHTGNALQSLMRLMAARPKGSESSYLQDLSQALVAVVCQRLIRDDAGKRLANYELLIVTDAVAAVIMRGDFKQLENAMTQGASGRAASFTFDEHLSKLVSDGRLSIAAALAGSPFPRATLEHFIAKRMLNRADEERLKSIYVV